MVCKSWRDLSRIGRDPSCTSENLLKVIKEGMTPEADDVDDLWTIRVAMRTSIVSENPDSFRGTFFPLDRKGGSRVRQI